MRFSSGTVDEISRVVEYAVTLTRLIHWTMMCIEWKNIYVKKNVYKKLHRPTGRELDFVVLFFYVFDRCIIIYETAVLLLRCFSWHIYNNIRCNLYKCAGYFFPTVRCEINYKNRRRLGGTSDFLSETIFQIRVTKRSRSTSTYYYTAWFKSSRQLRLLM